MLIRRAVVVCVLGAVAACNFSTQPRTSDLVNSFADLSANQRQQIHATTDSLDRLAAATGNILPLLDAAGSLQVAAETPDCPALEAAVDGSSVSASIDYGAGCNPVLFPDADVSGSVSGSITLGTSATLAAEFDSLVVNDRSLDGSMQGEFMRSGGLTSIAVDLTLATADGRLSGSARIQIEESLSLITIEEASFELENAEGESATVTMSHVIVNYRGNGNFYPQSGTATIEFPNDGRGAETISVEVTFTEQTPVDGTVIVTVQGGQPVEYTPGA